MRYKVGDRVRVRKDLVVGDIYGDGIFTWRMYTLLGKIVKISEVYTSFYRIDDPDYELCSWTDDMFEPITKLTATEVVMFAQEMCDSATRCTGCPVQEIRSKHSCDLCQEVKRKYADEYVEAVTKWVIGDTGKKEISIEQCSYLVIMDTDRNIVYEEQLKVGDDYRAVFKRYCEEHDGTYYAIIECRLGVKED